MGLFDRLFGKKKQEETKHDEPVSEKEVVENTQEPKNEEEIRETRDFTQHQINDLYHFQILLNFAIILYENVNRTVKREIPVFSWIFRISFCKCT